MPQFRKSLSRIIAGPLFLLFLLCMNASNAQPSAHSQDEILEAYRSQITPLKNFDKSHFTILVHAYNPFMARGFVEQLKEKGTYDPKRDINLLKEPERLKEKGMVSASIISEKQLPTFGRLLFILGFAPEDILATAPEDGYFIYKKKEILAEPPGPTMTPSEMLANTKPEEYNEVVLRSENLKLQGVAVKHMIRHNGYIDSPAETDQLRALAKERGLPFIELSQKCILQDEPVKVHLVEGVVTSLSLRHNGVGYFLNRYMQQRYFHPSKMDWEDISKPEYKEVRRLFESALQDYDGGMSFLEAIDEKMKARFKSQIGTAK